MQSSRKIVFVSGSQYSGKSRLGHMLASCQDSLFNYATPSPDGFFNRRGRLKAPRKGTSDKLAAQVSTLGHLMSGAIVHERRWMGTDHLFHYDYKRFASEVEQGISESINIGSFYSLLDQKLQLCRKEGESTSFTVFETENLHTLGFATPILRVIPNARIFVIVRDPVDQYMSMKADVLIRGPRTPTFEGSLSHHRNMLREYVETMQRSLYSLCEGPDGSQSVPVFPLRFEELPFLPQARAFEIARFVHGSGPEADRLAEHLQHVSDPSNELRNSYVSLDRSSQSYFKTERQAHLPVQIKREEQRAFMANWEIRLSSMYTPIYEYLMRERQRGMEKQALLTLFRFPKLYLESLWFGLKEVRENLPLSRRIRLRRNGHQLVVSSFFWLARFYLKVSMARLLGRDFRRSGRHDRVQPLQNRTGAGAE